MRLLPAQRASPIFSCSLMTRVGKLEFESSVEAAIFSWIACPNRREYRRRCETAGKSGKQIERCVIST